MSDNREINLLYLEIGKSLHATAGAINLDDNDYIKLGKRWFADNLGVMQAYICNNKTLVAKFSESSESELIAVLADVFAAPITVVPPVTLARLVVKMGVSRMCG